MDLSTQSLDFLTGRRFAANRAFSVPARGRAQRRSDRLIEMFSGLRVLHVGCCGPMPLVRDQLEHGTHLYANLCRSAAECVGVDRRSEGVAILRDLGFADAYRPEDVPNPAPDPPYDICLVTDAVEFESNPAAFLQGLLRFRFRHLVVAVPNGLTWRNALPAREVVNTDLRVWFTPYTLCKVLVDAGYRPERVELCHADFTTWRGALAARVMNLFPRWRDVLLVHAKPLP